MKKELFISNHIKPEITLEYIIKDDIYFYYGSDLKVLRGDSYILFGDVFSYNEDHPIQKGLSLLDNSDFDMRSLEKELYFWGGRFVLYYKNRFFMDYCGLLGLFYYNDSKNWYITSSLKLLYQNLKIKMIEDSPIFNWGGQFLNYFPLPQTMLVGVNKLDNCDGLEIREDIVLPFVRCEYFADTEYSNLNVLCDNIKIAFGYFLKDLKIAYGQHIALELTGGVDSRTNLAMLLANDCKPVVYSHYVPNFKRYEKVIPKRISKIYGLKYLFYSKKDLKNFSQDKLDEYDKQVCFSVADGDRYTYSHGLNIFDKDWVVLRNGIYESLIYYDEHFFTPFYGKDEFIEQIEKINHGLNKNVRASLEQWLDRFNEIEICKCPEFLNKFHLEQKNGGAWTSYIELGNELKNFTTIHPANCKYLLDLFRAFPDDMKNHNKDHQRYLIKSVSEELSSIPYNFSLWGSIKKRLKAILVKILPSETE